MGNVMLSEEQIEGLKSYAWEKNHDTDTFFIGGISIECFTSLTGYDLEKLQELKADNVSMGWDMVYGKPGTDKNHPISYYLQGIVYIDNKIFNEKHFVSDVDFLGLYTKEEKTEDLSEEEIIKKLSSALTLATDNLDIDSIVSLIDNNFADVSNRMRENFSEQLGVDDIGDILKEEILEGVSPSELPDSLFDDVVDDYLENNPNDCFDRIKDDVDDDTIKDFVKDYINDNL